MAEGKICVCPQCGKKFKLKVDFAAASFACSGCGATVWVEGKPKGRPYAGRYWHTDLSYQARPSMGSIMYAHQVPATGGAEHPVGPLVEGRKITHGALAVQVRSAAPQARDVDDGQLGPPPLEQVAEDVGLERDGSQAFAELLPPQIFVWMPVTPAIHFEHHFLPHSSWSPDHR